MLVVAASLLRGAVSAADTGVAGDPSAFASVRDLNRLALVSRSPGSEKSPVDHFREVADLIRLERAELLKRLDASEKEIASLADRGSRAFTEATVRRASLIEREQKAGQRLRIVEENLAGLISGGAPRASETHWAAATGEPIQPQLTTAEALALAERTLTDSERKLVDYWSLTPTVTQEEGRTLWRFRFHMKETNMPMDLSVRVVVDDASRAGKIESKPGVTH